MRLATTLLNSVATQGALFSSLRFRASASAYMNRTPATASNRKTWTFSAWIKRGKIATDQLFFSCSAGSNANKNEMMFNSDDTFRLETIISGSSNSVTTSQVFRDPSAWYHIIVAVDTTQATASNRVKFYVNGSQVTAFSAANYPSQNTDLYYNSTNKHLLGAGNEFSGQLYSDLTMTNVNFVDGQQLTASAFGRYNQQTGVWEPSYFKGTFGTNGYYLPFNNTTSTTTLGYDYSGNGNNWTTNNFSLTSGATYDSLTDVPTLSNNISSNYSVLNPLNKSTSATAIDGNLNANLGSSNWLAIASTMPFATGVKYYCEFTVQQQQGIDYKGIGIVLNNTDLTGYSGAAGSRSYEWVFFGHTSSVYNNNSEVVTGLSTYGVGDTIMFAFDYSSGYWWIGKNGTWYKSGDPATGSNPTLTGLTNSAGYTPFAVGYGGSTPAIWNMNYGQRPFAYTPPAGFKTLNTYNLPNSTIAQGNKFMDATLYTGTGSNGLTVTNAGSFYPDLIWIKSRNQAYYNTLLDYPRGTSVRLFSNLIDAESNNGCQSSFNNNGFTLNADSGGVNDSGTTYVAWQWNAGSGTTSSNTAGSVTSTVDVNQSAGFSIVTYTGNGVANSTVGHGLGSTPNFIIGKVRSTTESWPVFHTSLLGLGTGYFLELDATAAASNGNSRYPAAPNSTVVTIGSVGNLQPINANGQTYVMYCWTEIAGFSKFGSYTGNGSTDGPFIYTGFRPKFVLIKDATDANSDWIVYDTTRNPYNVTNLKLFPNTSTQENVSSPPGVDITTNVIDLLSNGIKQRNNNSWTNNSGSTYIYAAFAENPFKNALAR